MVVLSDSGCPAGSPFRDAVPQIMPMLVQDYRLDPTLMLWVEQHPANREELPDAKFWQIHPQWEGRRIVSAY